MNGGSWLVTPAVDPWAPEELRKAKKAQQVLDEIILHFIVMPCINTE